MIPLTFPSNDGWKLVKHKVSAVVIIAKIGNDSVQVDGYSPTKEPGYSQDKFDYLGEGYIETYNGAKSEDTRKLHFWKRK